MIKHASNAFWATKISFINEIANICEKTGAKVKVYDPIAMEEAKKHLFLPLTYCQNPYEAVKDAEAVVLLTEWDDFKKLDLVQVKNLVAKPIVIDGRNIFKLQEMQQLGFEYYSIGR